MDHRGGRPAPERDLPRASDLRARDGVGRTADERRAGPPALPRDLVDRPGLRRALDEAAACTLTELVGPAGSGKTVGVAAWVRRRAGRRDDDPPGGTRWCTVTPALTADALRGLLDRPGRVVLDDAHRLDAAGVEVLGAVLDAAPPGLHVVALTRRDLPLRRLVPVLVGAMAVVPGEHLRLTGDEARALVALHAPGCPPGVVEAILRHARGWAAAVVLTARAAARSRGDPARVPLAATDLVGQEAFASLAPRERHVVLAVCREDVVTVRGAVHLSGDAGARGVVEGLEETGLLVERDPAAPVGGSVGEPAPDDVLRAHPVLLQVARRRLEAGGADADRARAAVARAAVADLARGDLAAGLRRTLDGAGPVAAARVVAEHGLATVLHGEGRLVAQVVGRCTAEVADEPRAWPAAAAAAWSQGDVGAAASWAVRAVVPAGPPDGRRPREASAAIAHLLRAQLGDEDPAHALVAAGRWAAHDDAATPAELGLLRDLRGAAHGWLGDVGGAERALDDAVLTARTHGYDLLLADALTRLAATELLRHRPAAAAELAAHASRSGGAAAGTPVATAAAAVADAAAARLDPWRHAAAEPVPVPPVGHDLVATYLAHVTAAQRLALRGTPGDAHRALAVPASLPALPAHVRVDLLVRRTCVAAADEDVEALGEVAAELARLGADAASHLAAGLRAVLRAEPDDAVAHLRRAAGAEDHPDAATTAAVTLARLLASRDDAVAGRRLLADALHRAQHRGDATPFVGWVGHLVPVPVLLDEVRTAGPAAAWARRLATSARAYERLARGQHAGTSRPAGASWRPALTVRELEVVAHLARGATYADIAEALHLSTNTVKTHVTSLYAKLGASRRSEALATARTLELV